MGKTRLALEWIASGASAAWGTAHFCDLRHAETEHDLVKEVAQCLGLPVDHTGNGDTIEQALSSHPSLLLVLDNFESVVECAPVLGRWLDVAPNLRVLLTSRRMLRIRSEVVWELPPLPTPPVGSDADAAWQSDAVRLLWTRAQAAEPGLSLDEPAKLDLSEAARLLQGVPLALELAAARLGSITPHELVEEVRRGQLRLASPWRDHDPRHGTLEAAIERSWQLLAADERLVLAQLTVFRGGFTLDAAEAVVRTETMTRPTAAAIAALREASLLTLADDSTRRWDLLESIREFAAGHLDPSRAKEARARHAKYFLDQGEGWRGLLSTPRVLDARKRFAQERSNLSSAFEWFAAHGAGAPEELMRMGCVLHEALAYVMPSAAIEVATRALDATDPGQGSAHLQLSLLFQRASSAMALSRVAEAQADLAEAHRLVENGHAVLTSTQLLRGRCELFYWRGSLALALGRGAGSHRSLRNALELALDGKFLDLEARVRIALARIQAEMYADVSAFDELDRAAELLEQLGDIVTRAECLSYGLLYRVFFGRTVTEEKLDHLRVTLRDAGLHLVKGWPDLVRALQLLDDGTVEAAHARALTAYGELKVLHARQAASCALVIGNALFETDTELDQADQWYGTALKTFRQAGDRRFEACVHGFRVALQSRQGNTASARRHLGIAKTLLAGSGDRRLTAFVELQSASIDLAVAKRAYSASNFREFEERLQTARDFVSAARDEPLGEANMPPLAGCSIEARFSLRHLRREIESVARLSQRLQVADDGSWFQVGTSGPRQVAEGALTRRLLLELVEQRRCSPGAPILAADLVACCWPEEQFRGDSGSRRLRELVRRLRRAGLVQLRTGPDGGYFLDPSVPVVVEPALSDASTPND